MICMLQVISQPSSKVSVVKQEPGTGQEATTANSGCMQKKTKLPFTLHDIDSMSVELAKQHLTTAKVDFAYLGDDEACN